MSLPDLARVAGFEWDAGNARKNEKHGVTREEAEQVFDNEPLVVTEDPLHSETESRYDALGMANAGRQLQVAFTMRGRGSVIRVISARPMSRRERILYAKEETQADAALPLRSGGAGMAGIS